MKWASASQCDESSSPRSLPLSPLAPSWEVIRLRSELIVVCRRLFAIVCPYKRPMAWDTVEDEGVVTSGVADPSYGQLSQTIFTKRKHMKQWTFLHEKATWGLCVAYFVTTSSIRAYSSEEPRRADSREGIFWNMSLTLTEIKASLHIGFRKSRKFQILTMIVVPLFPADGFGSAVDPGFTGTSCPSR